MIQNKPTQTVAASLLLVAAMNAVAEDTNAVPSNKSGNNYFSPVPDNLLRDLSSNRPYTTESPFTMDAGLDFLITNSMQLDCGCYFGVTHAAEQYNPFAGITVRFYS